MSRKWKPSKAKAREFVTKMNEIDDYCTKNGISQSSSSDSYYFSHNGIDYRISNHAVEKSVSSGGWKYHGNSEEYRRNTFCIHAGKTRLIEIHKRILSGVAVDHRGNAKVVISCK